MQEHKQRMRSFYALEAVDRNQEEWLRAGGSARVPESRASHYFLDRKVEVALELTNAPRESRVLEVGCTPYVTTITTQNTRVRYLHR